jgi:hypothetical protein
MECETGMKVIWQVSNKLPDARREASKPDRFIVWAQVDSTKRLAKKVDGALLNQKHSEQRGQVEIRDC